MAVPVMRWVGERIAMVQEAVVEQAIGASNQQREVWKI
jgi:hypothetical protein